MISTKGRYAVRFMIDLAEQPADLPVPLEEDDSWVEEPNPPDTFEAYALALKEAAAGRGEKLKNFFS